MLPLSGMRIAVLVERDFEDLELWYPLYRLQEEGAETIVAGMGWPAYKGKHGTEIKSECLAAELDANNLDGVIIPGGWAPDRLRRDPKILAVVRKLYEQGKIVASICHGPWVMSSARICSGKRMTAVIALKDDLEFAGAIYVDEEVVRDGNLITSRVPSDLPAWGRAIVAAFKEQKASAGLATESAAA